MSSLQVKMYRFCEFNQFYREIPLSSSSSNENWTKGSACRCKLHKSLPKRAKSSRNPQSTIINISHIVPSTTTATEILEDVFEGNPTMYYKNTEFRKNVGPTDRNKFEKTQRIICNIANIVYNELVDAKGGVNGLEFHLLGHGFQNLDFSTYAKNVEEINFNGHMSYVTPAFQIIGQLTSLKKVSFNVGHGQHPFFLEIFDKEYTTAGYTEIMPNPSVTSLKVKINNRAFVTGSEMDMIVIMDVLDALFYRVSQCLPNVNQVELELPATGLSAAVFKGIIFNARMHSHVQMNVSIAAGEVGMMMMKCYIGQKPTQDFPLFAPIQGNFENSATGTFERSLKSLFYKLDGLAELLEEFRKSETGRKLLGTTDFPSFVADPPSQFEQWFTEVKLFDGHRCTENSCPDAISTTGSEQMDNVLKSLIISEQTIKEHSELIKVALPQTWVEKVGDYLGLMSSRV